MALTGALRPSGVDDRGREVKSFVGGVVPLQNVLDGAKSDNGYVEEPDGAITIAAAAVIVARVPGGPALDSDDEVDVLSGMPSLADLVPLARSAIAQVLRASEWRELWDDAYGSERAFTALKRYSTLRSSYRRTPMNRSDVPLP